MSKFLDNINVVAASGVSSIFESTLGGSATITQFKNNDVSFPSGQEMRIDFMQSSTNLARMAVKSYGTEFGFNFYGTDAGGFLNSTPILTAKGSKKVGINQDSPDAMLHISGVSGMVSTDMILKIRTSGLSYLMDMRADGHTAFGVALSNDHAYHIQNNDASAYTALMVTRSNSGSLLACFEAGYTNINYSLAVGRYFRTPSAVLDLKVGANDSSLYQIHGYDSDDQLLISLRADGEFILGNVFGGEGWLKWDKSSTGSNLQLIGVNYSQLVIESDNYRTLAFNDQTGHVNVASLSMAPFSDTLIYASNKHYFYNVDKTNPLTTFNVDTEQLTVAYAGTAMMTVANGGPTVEITGFGDDFTDISFRVNSENYNNLFSIRNNGYIDAGTQQDLLSNPNLVIGVGASAGDQGDNISIGWNAGSSQTVSSHNILIGVGAGSGLTSNGANVAIGVRALQYGNGGGNVAIGDVCASTLSGGGNVYIGVYAGGSSGAGATGDDNVGIGRSAVGSITNGIRNVGLGYGALFTSSSASYNTSLGMFSGYENITGGSNTFVGYASGYSTTAGNSNLFLGIYSGYYETGDNKLFIDNAMRANEADGRTKALVYGVFDASTTNQVFTINAATVKMPYVTSSSSAMGVLGIDGTGRLYNTGVSGAGITEITYSALATLKGSSSLVVGKMYKITDRGDQGIIIQALGANVLSKAGVRFMNCPVTYELNETVGSYTYKGVYAEIGLGISPGDLFVWAGKYWWAVYGTNVAPIDEENLDPSEYELLPKPSYGVTDTYYGVYQFNVLYDFENDWIEKQWDTRGNVCGITYENRPTNTNPVDLTDWNYATSGYEFRDNRAIGIYNNRCTHIFNNNSNYIISGNAIADGGLSNNNNNGNIQNNIDIQEGIHHNSNKGEITNNVNVNIIQYNSHGGSVNECNITGNIEYNDFFYEGNESINSVVSPVLHVRNNRAITSTGILNGGVYYMDITGLTTLPTFNNIGHLIDRLYLTSSNATESIDAFHSTISNIYRDLLIEVDPALTVTFVHGAGALAPKCEGGINAVINGATGDFIEFRRRANFIRQCNIGTY